MKVHLHGLRIPQLVYGVLFPLLYAFLPSKYFCYSGMDSLPALGLSLSS